MPDSMVFFILEKGKDARTYWFFFMIQPLISTLSEKMLAERYHLGFPVIKELIQNSDDAKAQQMVIGWTMGVPQVSNPLLRGPGVFYC